MHQCARNGNALQLAPRELFGMTLGQCFDSHRHQHFLRASAALGFSDSQQVQGKRYILFDRQVGQNMKGLEDKANGTAPQQRRGVIVQCRKIDAFENHSPAIGRIETRQEIEQRRLAHAGLAHDGKVLAAAKFEINALKDCRPILRKAFA
jgi:hypothetical protein